ncbi:MAG: RloB family protein [Bacteroidales bacterium]
MAKRYRQSKGKEVRPTYFVFCEGESEEAYIAYIRSKYRVPIEIKSKVAGSRISQQFVNRVLKYFPLHEKDRTFLFYDLDVPEVLTRLQSVNGAILIVSNPCLELWYILHTCNQSAERNSQQIVSQLDRICHGYTKGSICFRLKHKLSTVEDQACSRAKRLTSYNNPSTTVYRLLEQIKTVNAVSD